MRHPSDDKYLLGAQNVYYLFGASKAHDHQVVGQFSFVYLARVHLGVRLETLLGQILLPQLPLHLSSLLVLVLLLVMLLQLVLW